MNRQLLMCNEFSPLFTIYKRDHVNQLWKPHWMQHCMKQATANYIVDRRIWRQTKRTKLLIKWLTKGKVFLSLPCPFDKSWNMVLWNMKEANKEMKAASTEMKVVIKEMIAANKEMKETNKIWKKPIKRCHQ